MVARAFVISFPRPHSLLGMRFASLLTVVVAAWNVVAQVEDAAVKSESLGSKKGVCLKPARREEWRTLSKKEKKAFIDAVKVRLSRSARCVHVSRGYRFTFISVSASSRTILNSPRLGIHLILRR
jgi:hypothetical protein